MHRDERVTDEMVEEMTRYALRYGGGCRDCADVDGFCRDGQPCDYPSRVAVTKHTIRALAYGFQHGFLNNPLSAALSEQTLPVRVKMLEWRPEPPYHVARVFGGLYAVETWDGGVTLSGIPGRRDFKTLEAAKSAAQQDYETRIRSAIVGVAVEPVSLDDRMKAAGMYTVAEMMGVTPLTKWMSNPAINTVEAFSEWLDRKVSEYLKMKAAYDLGDKDESDELYEWVQAHSAVFSTIRDQFQVVLANPTPRISASSAAAGGSAISTIGGDE